MVRSDNSKGERKWKVESTFGRFDDEGQAKRFDEYLSNKVLEDFVTGNPDDITIAHGDLVEGRKAKKLGVEYFWTVTKKFRGFKTEEQASNLFNFLQNEALLDYEGQKQAQLVER